MDQHKTQTNKTNKHIRTTHNNTNNTTQHTTHNTTPQPLLLKAFLVVMDVSAFVDFINLVSRPSNVTKANRDKLKRLAVIIQGFMTKRYDTAIYDNRHTTQLRVYGSDGWGCFVTEHFFNSQFHIRRDGRVRAEFLLELALLKFKNSFGELVTIPLCQMPRPLTKGKKGWNILQAALDFVELGRASALGYLFSVYLQDGLFAQQFTRRMRALHSARYDDPSSPNFQDYELQNKDIVFGIKCPGHGCSNALKNPLRECFPDERVIDDAKITILSLRNGSAHLFGKIDFFLQVHRVFQEFTQDDALLRTFWTCLGVPEKHIDLFVEVSPIWDGSNLLVKASLKDDPDGDAKLVACLQFGLQWTQVIELRWAGVHPSGKHYLLSMAIGVPGLWKMCLDDPNISMEKLNGFSRWTNPQVRSYLAVSAMGTSSMHAMSLKVLKDDRFLKNNVQVWEAMVAEFDRILALSDGVWDLIALVGGLDDPYELRDTCVSLTHSSFGFIHNDSFRQLLQEPLKWTQGNITENVAHLGSCSRLELKDTASLQMRDSLDAGGLEVELVDGLALVQEAPCSTTLLEQGHGRASPVLRQHKRIGAEYLSAAALVTQTACLIKPSAHVLNVAKVEARLKRLEDAAPIKVTGKSCFIAARSNQNSSRADASLAGSSFANHSDSCQRLNDEYAQLSGAEKHEWFEDACDARRDLRHALNTQRVKLLAELELAEKDKDEDAKDFRNHYQFMKFSDEELANLCESYTSKSVTRDFVQLELNRHLEAPPAPLAEDQEWIMAAEDAFRPPKEEQPWWVKRIATHKAAFRRTAIGVVDSDVVYIIVFIAQSPHGVFFLKAKRRLLDLSALSRPGHDLSADDVRDVIFEYWPPRYLTAADVDIDDDAEFEIREGIRFPGRVAASRCEPVLFQDFVRHHKPVAREVAQRPRRSAVQVNSIITELRLEFPFLTDDDLGIKRKKLDKDYVRKKKPRLSDGGGGGDSDDSKDRSDGDAFEVGSDKASDGSEAPDLFEDLDERLAAEEDRFHWEAPDDYFYTKLLKGRWTLKHVGVVADGIVCLARAGPPKAWCTKYRYPKQMAFYFARYDEENAYELAKEACRRSNFFYRVFAEHGSRGDFLFTDELLATYEPNLEFYDWICGLDVDSPSFERGNDLIVCKPLNPEG
jgi:hypothetical protein